MVVVELDGRETKFGIYNMYGVWVGKMKLVATRVKLESGVSCVMGGQFAAYFARIRCGMHTITDAITEHKGHRFEPYAVCRMSIVAISY
jgi:hypothetical protein